MHQSNQKIKKLGARYFELYYCTAVVVENCFLILNLNSFLCNFVGICWQRVRQKVFLLTLKFTLLNHDKICALGTLYNCSRYLH